MARRGASMRPAEAGFTLLEALVAVALMGLILSAFGAVTAQWLPNWSRGLFRIQRSEKLAVVLDRLVADVSAAEYISGNGVNRSPIFEGGEAGVIFVRSTIGPNTGPGLEIVRIAETMDAGGPVLVRTRAPFMPTPATDVGIDRIPFGDPVVLLRPPFRVTFSYAGANGKWDSVWRGQGVLPATVRMTLGEMNGKWVPLATTAAEIHVDLAAPQEALEREPEQQAQAQQGGSRSGGSNR